MSVIAVIDYDMGNLHSVCKGLEQAGSTPKITNSAKDISQADAIILPGVGSFDPAMIHLKELDLISPIKDVIASGKPFLGICLGLQILFESSEEGTQPGLGIIPGIVKKIKSEPNLTIPHMGWNQLILNQSLPLWNKFSPNPWVYFVHSYYADPLDPSIIAATVTHGTQNLTAAIAHKNIIAVQFHPEKSSNIGLQLLTNFIANIKVPLLQ